VIKLYINLSDLKDTGARKHVVLDFEFNDFKYQDREIGIKNPFHLDADIFNTKDSFLIRGSMKGEFILECSRCLEKYNSELSLEIEEEVLKEEMEDADELHIADIIRDNILLSLPIKTLCSPDCKGLCPHCGQNLNRGECDCEVEQVDPRLAKLKNFFDTE